MGWIKIDDCFYDNPKVEQIGNVGAGVYVKALSYCGRHLTDGEVPVGWAKRIGGSVVHKIEEAGLWDRRDGVYVIRDYLDFNPSRADVLARREADKGRKR